MKRPNILYMMMDQQKASAASFLGNKRVPSPFMDSMAERGIAFSNAYAPSSICTPSRTSVFTGVHPLVHQVTCHQNRAPQNLPQLSELLQKAGYYTSVIGHYEENRNLSRGWHEQVPMKEAGPIREAYQRLVLSGRKDVGWSAGAIDCKPEEGLEFVLAERAYRMINEMEKAQKAGNPFFFHAAYNTPHPPYFVPKPYSDLVPPSDVVLPRTSGPLELTPQWRKKVQEECGTADATEEDIRRTIAAYYGMIAYGDAAMKKVYDRMDARGLLDDTWIIISSDHGDYTGEKGLFTKNETCYECLLHVPLIICPPKNLEMHEGVRGSRVDDFVDLIDLFPTMLEMAGEEVPEYTQGWSLLWEGLSGQVERAGTARGSSSDKHKRPKDALFAQVGDYHGYIKTSFPGGMPASGRHPSLVQGVRTRNHSYIADPDYGDEAYDLGRDPEELDNLLLAGGPYGGGGQPGASGPSENLQEWAKQLQERINEWEETCLALRKELGVIPGDRGFYEGWE